MYSVHLNNRKSMQQDVQLDVHSGLNTSTLSYAASCCFFITSLILVNITLNMVSASMMQSTELAGEHLVKNNLSYLVHGD